MPSLKTFRIDFDRPGATFTAGEVVSGNVLVNLAKAKNVRGLYLSTKGEASVAWPERKKEKDSQGKTRTRTVYYKSSEKYFDLSISLLGTQGSDNRVNIPVGHHTYPFSFQLPANIPSSFEDHHGYIRYTVKATIDRPWKFDHDCKVAFTVLASLDLNTRPSECLGIEDDVEKNFCGFFCFSAGSIHVRTRIPVAGFVPGQRIETSVSYQNSSRSVDVTGITTKLERTVRFHARLPKSATKTVKTDIIADKTHGPFGKDGRVISKLQIPPVPPSYLEHCNIIDLDYKLIACVHVSGMHCKVDRGYSVLIGTIPLYPVPSAPNLEGVEIQGYPMPMPLPNYGATESTPYPYPGSQPPTGGLPDPRRDSHMIGFVAGPQAAASTSEWNMPPPSYEQCVMGAEHIKDQNESNYVYGANEPFAPRYPVFNFPPQSISKQ